MNRSFTLFALLAVACSSPGLPPAGPKPGETDIGYDTKPTEKTTGAVTTVPTEKTGANRPFTLEELLRGKVAGLQVLRGPGGTTVYRIRGQNSLLSDKEPLFVVDGVQMNSLGAERAISGLTLSDIRQVDVLKDVASTSVYGTAAAGGVILITTRR